VGGIVLQGMAGFGIGFGQGVSLQHVLMWVMDALRMRQTFNATTPCTISLV